MTVFSKLLLSQAKNIALSIQQILKIIQNKMIIEFLSNFRLHILRADCFFVMILFAILLAQNSFS